MSRRALAAGMAAALTAALAGALGCSDLNEQAGGVVALEVRAPVPATVEVGDTIQLQVRALDKNGDSVAAEITWQTLDTIVAVTPDGRATGRRVGNGSVVARNGTLVSTPLQLAVLARVDSLAVAGPARLMVAATDTASAPLAAQLLARDSTGTLGPAANQQFVYAIVAPTFADPAQRTVQLWPAAGVVDTVTSGADGGPTQPVTLARVAGQPSPDSVIVEIRRDHRSGRPVAGSGQQFVVVFE